MAGDILLGVIIGAQGLKGEVKVKTFTDRPENLGAYGALHAPDGRRFVLRHARPVKADLVVAAIDGVGDRDAAEALKGIELFIARDALPPPDEDEFYHADLIGLSAVDTEGRHLGAVGAVQNFGAGDVIVIAQADGSELLLPFTREIVPEIDIAAGRIVIAAPDEGPDRDEGRLE